MSFDKLPFNWFDLLIFVLLFVGLQRGRKHGMSEELVGMLTWLTIAVGCAILYNPIGTLLAQSSVFSLLSSYLMAYVGIALVVIALFAALKKTAGEKLIGSDIFGKSEFYLGMAAGMLRLTCILIAGLALLNARHFNEMEIKAAEKNQKELYGSNFFPSLYEVQSQVFDKSLTGPWIKRQFPFLLIKPTVPDEKKIQRPEFATP
jgi:hypothetical protein